MTAPQPRIVQKSLGNLGSLMNQILVKVFIGFEIFVVNGHCDGVGKLTVWVKNNQCEEGSRVVRIYRGHLRSSGSMKFNF